VASAIAFGGETFVIHGVLIDSEGNPLAGATVTAVEVGGESPRATKTNKKGRFAIRIPDVDLAYELTFVVEGYASATATVHPNPENMRPLTVTLTPGGQGPAQPPAASEEAGPDSEVSGPAPAISEARRAAVAVFNEGVAALEAEETATALAKFKQASEIDPEYANAFNAISVIAVELEDWATAADAAEALVRLQPDNLDAISTAYFSELKTRDFDRAIPAARRLAAAKPGVVTDDMAQHAQVMFNEKEYEASKALLEIIVESAPDFAPAYLQLGLTCSALQDAECGVRALERFLELSPDDPEAATARSLLDYMR
jgi:Tfp pilus assembly protein PilF